MIHTPTTHQHHHYHGNASQRFLIFLMIAIGLILLAMASMVSADDQQKPDEVISQTTTTMLAALKQNKSLIRQQPDHVYTLTNQIIMPHVDFKRMSSWVLGKHWRRASNEQKQAFPAEFRTLILRTYATALSAYTDETVTYLPLRNTEQSDDVTVKTIIERSAGPDIPVAYRMHNTQQGWKVYDISIDGISLVNNYRRSFSNEIRRHGLDGLINKLAIKNRAVKQQEQQLARN